MEPAEGLSRAYSTPSGVFVSGSQMFIAGTDLTNRGGGGVKRAFEDVLSDANLPGPFGVRATPRFKVARTILARNPQVTHLYGHSLGGAISTVLARDNNLQNDAWAAPLRSWQRDAHQHAHYWDPVAALNRGAVRTASDSWYPHGYP
jgi:hypothetical protein